MHRGRKIGINTVARRLGLTGSEIALLIAGLGRRKLALKEKRSVRITDKGLERIAPMLKLYGFIAPILGEDDDNLKNMNPAEARMFVYNLMYGDNGDEIERGVGRTSDIFGPAEQKILLKTYLHPGTTRDDIVKFSAVTVKAYITDNPDKSHYLEDKEYIGYALSDTLDALDRLIPDFVSEEPGSGILTLTRTGHKTAVRIMEDAEHEIKIRLPESVSADTAGVDAEIFMRRPDIDMAAYYGSGSVFSAIAKEMGAGGSGEKIHA
jgi:hypothetical protein